MPSLSVLRMKPIESKRIALERKIVLRFADFEGFITEYAANLSMTGMFVRTDEPQPPGTPVRFEFRLKDGARLIRGNGWVVWSRADKKGPDQPAGMGIEFTELDRESRRVIRWLILNQTPDESDPFDVNAGTARGPHTQYGTMAIDSSRTVWVGVLTGFGIAGVLAALIYLYGAGGSPSVPARVGVDNPSRSANASELGANGPGYQPAAIERPGSRGPNGIEPPLAAGSAAGSVTGRSTGVDESANTLAADSAQAEQLVREWARAWSEQDVDRYLAHYARDFQPESGMALADWQAQRRQRLTAPKSIRVAVARLEVEPMSSDELQVTFLQTYRSENYSDTVDKTLVLRREDGGWKIGRERSD